MRVIDCHWEQKNIGKKTGEITIETSDHYDCSLIEKQTLGYEYVVVKVPMNKPAFNLGLSKLGYTCIETQMNVGIDYNNFIFSKVAHLYDDTSYEIVNVADDFKSVVSHIEPGMFSTDRISIDPEFGEAIGCQRYINWLTTEYESKRSQLIKVLYKKEHVGFMLIKIENDTIDLLLNGLYKEYQGKGIGLLTPASPMMYVKKNDLQIARELTSISSNNIPVVKLYSRLQFQLISQTYVYIKHKLDDTL